MSYSSMTFGVFYDFRNPAQFREDWTRRYREILRQIDWLEGSSNFDAVSISEHHFVDDGYTPSVLALAAAVAAKTERLQIGTNILQLPLHHPLRIAEDALTVDTISGGRFRLGVALGYRELEFLGLGTTPRLRRSRMEEGIAILRHAFSGRPFAFEGENWSFPELKVSPPPVRAGGPPIWMGGTVTPALARAAQLGDGFLASVVDEVVGYLEACSEIGLDPDQQGTCLTAWAIVDEDPDRALQELGPYMLHQVNGYIDFGFLEVPYFEHPQQLIDAGFYTMVDAAGAIEYFGEAWNAGVKEIQLFGQIPGEPVESGSRRLQYISEQVIPNMNV
jgi:alkanesulfonate monooxygenase SsuD/methylene tetrahydromethanopterin reductase-like flavin-dependent oxidoreductase (luciferase family)